MINELRESATELVNTWIEYINAFDDSDSQEADSAFRNILESNLTSLEMIVKHYNGKGTIRVLVEMTLPTIRADLSQSDTLFVNQKFNCVLYTLIAIYATLHPNGPLSQEPYEQTPFYAEFDRVRVKLRNAASLGNLKPFMEIVLDMLSA